MPEINKTNLLTYIVYQQLSSHLINSLLSWVFFILPFFVIMVEIFNILITLFFNGRQTNVQINMKKYPLCQSFKSLLQ